MNMTVDFETEDPGHAESRGGGGLAGSGHGEGPTGSPTRGRILQIALTLMSQRGVDGTSMRDLASAAGLNVASLYHYFPSKRELLEAVLVEQGFLPVNTSTPDPTKYDDIESPLGQLLADILVSMFEVEDFVRLMVGEAIRAETTARAVGLDLFTTFQSSIEEWITEQRPDLAERAGAGAVARMLSAMVVGVFIEHASGAIADGNDDVIALSLQRAREAAAILQPPPA